MIEIKVPSKLFHVLSYIKVGEFNRFLHERIVEYKRYLEWNDRDSLIKTKEELEKKLQRMREELIELQEFCETAEMEQQMMIRWIDDLDEENKKLMMKMSEDGSSIKIGRI